MPYISRIVAVKSLFPYRSRTTVVVRTSVRFRTVRNVAEVRSLPPLIRTAVRNEASYVVRKCSARSRDIDTCYIACIYGHEGTVNSDGLQQLQMVVDDSKAPAFAELPELIVN